MSPDSHPRPLWGADVVGVSPCPRVHTRGYPPGPLRGPHRRVYPSTNVSVYKCSGLAVCRGLVLRASRLLVSQSSSPIVQQSHSPVVPSSCSPVVLWSYRSCFFRSHIFFVPFCDFLWLYMRKLTRARFGAHIGGGHPRAHGFTPVATYPDRFAVRFGGCISVAVYRLFVLSFPFFVFLCNVQRN